MYSSVTPPPHSYTPPSSPTDYTQPSFSFLIPATDSSNCPWFINVLFSRWCTQNSGRDSSDIFSSCRRPSLHRRGTCRGGSGLGSFRLVTWLIRWSRIWRWLRCSFCRISYIKGKRYVLLLFRPVDWQVLNAKPFPEIRDNFGDGVNDMGDLITNNKLDILGWQKVTLAASSSPMNRPSLILIGPKTN